jgi:hypothetical protein
MTDLKIQFSNSDSWWSCRSRRLRSNVHLEQIRVNWSLSKVCWEGWLRGWFAKKSNCFHILQSITQQGQNWSEPFIHFHSIGRPGAVTGLAEAAACDKPIYAGCSRQTFPLSCSSTSSSGGGGLSPCPHTLHSDQKLQEPAASAFSGEERMAPSPP